MAAKLKVFHADTNTWVAQGVLDLLGEPSHRRQANVLIVAATKVAAIGYVRSLPGRWVGEPRPAGLRLAESNDVGAMTAAGLFGEPAVFVFPLRGGDTPVARIDADGPKVVGQIMRVAGQREFEAAGTVTLKVTPEARERLARHLQMQSVASLDECRRQADEILAVLAGPTGGSN